MRHDTMMDNITIELTAEEKTLADQIEFEALNLEDHLHAEANARLAVALIRSLIDRDAIPEQRRKYFGDPSYNPGGRGSSRKQIFERNGCRGEAILRHPHFLAYLRYFIHGADLPPRVAAEFRAAVEECGMVTSSDVVPLGHKARRLARQLGLAPHDAREEFFKLALDCGLSAGTAIAIRESAGKR